MSKKNIIAFLHKTIQAHSHVILNRHFLKQLGIQETLFLSELLEIERYLQEKNILSSDGYFYHSQNKIERNTALTKFQQKACCDNLEHDRLILTDFRGLPRKKYYKIHHQNILDAFKQSKKTIGKKTLPGYIYILQQTGKNVYKIGRTSCPQKRRKMLHVKLPFKVNFVYLIEYSDSVTIEAELHQVFNHKRLNGEWFSLSDEDINLIKSYKPEEMISEEEVV